MDRINPHDRAGKTTRFSTLLGGAGHGRRERVSRNPEYDLLQYLCQSNHTCFGALVRKNIDNTGRNSAHVQFSEPLRLRFPTWLPTAA